MAEVKTFSKQMLFAKLQKDFGKGTIITLDDDNAANIVTWISTGAYNLDDATSWGLPGGRIVEYFGAESSGKTTALMAAMIENERSGGENFLGDAEGTFGQDRYKEMGGNPKTVNLFETGTLEQFYDKLKLILKYAEGVTHPILVGVDTLTMIIPKALMEAEGDEQPVAPASRVNSRHLPTINETIPKNVCLLLLSQVRDKVGAAAWGAADANIDTPGGRIVKHVSSVRVFFNKVGLIDNGKSKELRKIIGIRTEAKVVKNKVGPPLRKAAFRIMFDKRGLDNARVFLDTCVEKKVIPAPASSVYTVKGVKFKPDQFPLIIKKFPKWTDWALDQCFELFHHNFDADRYKL